jgi:hypothetical protein
LCAGRTALRIKAGMIHRLTSGHASRMA